MNISLSKNSQLIQSLGISALLLGTLLVALPAQADYKFGRTIEQGDYSKGKYRRSQSLQKPSRANQNYFSYSRYKPSPRSYYSSKYSWEPNYFQSHNNDRYRSTRSFYSRRNCNNRR